MSSADTICVQLSERHAAMIRACLEQQMDEGSGPEGAYAAEAFGAFSGAVTAATTARPAVVVPIANIMRLCGHN